MLFHAFIMRLQTYANTKQGEGDNASPKTASFGARFASIVRNSLNVGPIEMLPVTSGGAFAHLSVMVSNLMVRPVLTELREFKVDPSNSPN